MTIAIYRYIFIVFLFSLLGQLSYADKIKNGQSKYQQTFTLKQISKIEQATLIGKNPSYTLYLPIHPQWRIEGLHLNLNIRFSPILLSSSTLTVLIDNTPIDSIYLKSPDNVINHWEIKIPSHLIKEKDNVLAIHIVGYLKISEDICDDIENKANWVNIEGNSTVTYIYGDNTKQNLANFPYPFIQKSSPGTDFITLVLPNDINALNFSPYFKMAQMLAKKSSWRGVHFNLISFDKFLSSSVKQNAIIIGTPDNVEFTKLPINFPLSLIDNKWTLSGGSHKLPEKKGFVFLAPNPTAQQYQLLVISSNSYEGIDESLENLNLDRLSYEIDNPTFYTSQSIKEFKPKQTSDTRIDFQELGYVDNLVFGEGQQSMQYQFNLPPEYTEKPVQLYLLYSHSPFLDKNNTSYLMVEINGLPIDGVKIDPESAEKKAIEFTLPQKQLKVGTNTLKITFDLRLKSADCNRYYLSRAWGIIYEKSQLVFSRSNTYPKRVISLYPYFLDNRVEVVLPDNKEIYQDKSILKELITFASSLTSTHSLNTIIGTTEKFESNNLVYLGLGKNESSPDLTLQPMLNQFIQNLTLTKNKAFQSINPSLFNNILVEDKHAGFIGIAPSKTNQDKTLFMLYGYTLKDLKSALSLVNDNYKRLQLNGNLAVAFTNGTYTSLSTEKVEEAVNKEIKTEKIGQSLISYGIIALLLLVPLIIVIFLYRLMRNH